MSYSLFKNIFAPRNTFNDVRKTNKIRRERKNNLTNTLRKKNKDIIRVKRKFIKRPNVRYYTYLRSHIIVPEMIDQILGIYNGYVFTSLQISPNFVGRRVGEFVFTRRYPKHPRVKSDKFLGRIPKYLLNKKLDKKFKSYV